jgi:hypothetical protein
MMKKLLLSFALSLSFFFGFSQVKSGEKLVFSGAYNMSGIMTPLAQITMSTETVTTAKSTYLHLSCEAATYSKWDSFFKIRDLYESYVNPTTLKPSLYKRNITEGGFSMTEKYIYKPDGKTVKSTSKVKNRPENSKEFTIGSTSQDVISILYKLRTLNFNTFKIGQTSSFTVVFDEKEIPVVLKYMGKESIPSGNLDTKECYKISIAARTKVLKGTDKNLIWLTADSKKIPTLIKFSIPVGIGQLSLTTASGI